MKRIHGKRKKNETQTKSIKHLIRSGVGGGEDRRETEGATRNVGTDTKKQRLYRNN